MSTKVSECGRGLADNTYATVGDEQLGEGTMVAGTFAAHGLNGMDGSARDAGDAAKRRLGRID